MLKPMYTYDSEGFFKGEVLAQEDRMNPGTWIESPDATFLAPDIDDAHWAKFDGTAWQKVAKPTTAAECVGVVISHESQTPHDQEFRKLMEELTKGSTTHRLERGEDKSWYVVEITTAEMEAVAAQAALSDFDAQTASLEKRLGLAMLRNDQDQISALRDEYKALMEGGE